jgi:Arc/MetJ-type ribon-helix-helix transcriptional regulator
LTRQSQPDTLKYEPDMSAQERVTIKIPKPIYNRITEIIEDTGFSSATDFIVYVLRDVIAMRSDDSSKYLNRTEIESIRQRLKSLGYL